MRTSTPRGDPYAVRRYEGLGPYGARNELGALLTKASHIGLGTMLLERAWFDELGRFSIEADSHGDLEWCLRLAAAGKRFGYTPEPLLAVRRHDANDSSPASFHGGGRSLRGLLYCLERSVTPDNARALRGWDVAIVAAVRHFFGYLRHLGAWDALAGEAESRFGEIERRLAAIEAAPYAPVAGWPRVTVAVATDGRRPGLLLPSLASALAQTYRDFEIVVVGTSGAPLAPLLRAIDPERRIRFVQQHAALDAPPPRTNAVELGRGEIVAYLREPDLWEPDHLERAVAAIDAGAAAVRGGARHTLIAYDVPGDGSVAPPPPRELGRFEASVAGAIGASEVWNAVPLSAVVHRRRAFDLAGKFDANLPALDELAFLMRLQRAVGIVPLDASTVVERTVLDRASAPGRAIGTRTSPRSTPSGAPSRSTPTRPRNASNTARTCTGRRAPSPPATTTACCKPRSSSPEPTRWHKHDRPERGTAGLVLTNADARVRIEGCRYSGAARRRASTPPTARRTPRCSKRWATRTGCESSRRWLVRMTKSASVISPMRCRSSSPPSPTI